MAKKLPVAIDKEEFVLLLKHTKAKHHKVAFLLGFATGLRISEVLGLEGRDVDFQERRILVRQGKGKKDRIVPMPKGFKPSMMRYIPIKCKIRALEAAFKRAARRAGLLEKKPSLHFHSLRHGFGSTLANQGMPIHHIRTLMGHTNISTTNVYLEMNPKKALEDYENLF